MVSDFVYWKPDLSRASANAQQPQSIDNSIIEYVATGVISLEMFNEGILWEDFANSKEHFVWHKGEEELLFPDDEDVIEYINELTQKAIEEQKHGEKFYSLEELQEE